MATKSFWKAPLFVWKGLKSFWKGHIFIYREVLLKKNGVEKEFVSKIMKKEGKLNYI